MVALACDLTNSFPSDVWADRELIEIETAAYLQARIYEELWSE